MKAWCVPSGLTLAGLVAVSGCGPAPRTALRGEMRGAPQVRVALAEKVSDLILRARGGVVVRCCDGGSWSLADGATLRFVEVDGEVAVATDDGSERHEPRLVVVDPADSSARVVFGDMPCRGRLEVYADGGRLTLVGRLDLETYLRGVVPWEIGWSQIEARAAVEAQAVAARTYACARLGQYPGRPFDLYADVRDQVYNGARREDPVSDAAIAATRGLVLEHSGRLIQAYYCSTCGGYTSWIDHVWSKPPQPYLCGTRDAPAGEGSYCAGSRHFRWSEAWSGAELEATLAKTLPAVLHLRPDSTIGGLLDLAEVERDDSGRVLDLRVRTTKGTWDVRGDSIRWVLKPVDRPLLRSTLFKLELTREGGALVEVVARGGGNGHGVGMCQAGALEMARRGSERGAILTHYYPGASLHRAY